MLQNLPMQRDDLTRRIDAIEEAYEFFLAFAAQGLDEGEASSGSQLRHHLSRADEALGGIVDVFEGLIKTEELSAAHTYVEFALVLARDAESARAAIRLVEAMKTVSAQLIDNLNASIHVRALLTDLFLIDEVLKLDTESKRVPGPQ